MISNGTLLSRAAQTLNDPAGRYWSSDTLLDYLNAGLTQIVMMRPDAYTQVRDVALVAGVNQTLPDDGMQFLDAHYNVASGQGILQRSMDTLTHAIPTWAKATAATDILHVIPDERDPSRYRCYPPSNGSSVISLEFSAIPPQVSASDAFPFRDIFQTAAWAYICGVALIKQTDRQDPMKSKYFMELFNSSLAVNQQQQDNNAPAVETVGSKN